MDMLNIHNAEFSISFKKKRRSEKMEYTHICIEKSRIKKSKYSGLISGTQIHCDLSLLC